MKKAQTALVRFFSRFNSIKTLIVFCFSILLVVLVFVLSVVYFGLYTKKIQKKADTYTYQIVEQVGKHINSYFGYIENIANIISSNFDVLRYLNQASLGKEKELDFYRSSVRNSMDSFISTRKDIVSAFLFDQNLYAIGNNKAFSAKTTIDYTQEPWFKNAIAAQGSAVLTPTHIQSFIHNHSNWVVSISKSIQSQKNESLGVLLIDLNYETIKDICSSIDLGEKGYVFIVDDDGQIIYHPQLKKLYSGDIEENIAAVIGQTGTSVVDKAKMYTIFSFDNLSNSPNWKVVGVSFTDELQVDSKEVFNASIAIVAFSIMFALLAASIIAKTITLPLTNLEKMMNNVENGDFKATIAIESGSGEIKRLGKAFNTLVSKIQSLINQALIDQSKVQKSELKALQAQINPHFLYNTLESIIWMAESQNNSDIVALTSSLAKYYRTGLSKGRDIVTIAEELEHARNYLVIQKIRYEQKLEYEFEIDPAVLSLYTNKLIIQPIIENAIYHGIRPLESGGKIIVRAFLYNNKKPQNDCVIVTVEDNGVGISEKDLQSLLYKNSQDANKLGGVGLQNVNNRIRLSSYSYITHDDIQFGLKITSIKNHGTVVDLVLPKITHLKTEDL